MEENRKLFFRTTSIRRFYLQQEEYQNTKLSQREVDCIFYLIQNKTAIETAELMNISRRTVESYIENIKIKLACESKAAIIKKFRNNQYLLALH